MIDFHRFEFYPVKKKILSNDLLSLLYDNIIKSNITSNFTLEDISSIDFFRKNSILFLESNIKLSTIPNDIIIITSKKLIFDSIKNNKILVHNISESYNIIINEIFFHDDSPSFTDEFNFKNGSYISKFATLDNSVILGNNCSIGRGVKIGSNTIIKDNVVIKNAIIGSGVIVSSNTTIGSTGFGFDFNKRGASFLNPQIGIVYIDDNSRIGSGCTIDRAKIDTTYVGRNCMIDNLVHIAHNVHILDNACIAAQTGISGSVHIDKNVTIGGQVGIAGHLNIGKNVIIAAKSGVTKNINENSAVAGFPALDIKLWKKNIIRQRKNGY